ncbi:MAG: hypothetical protein IJ575_06095 [Selenomonadaceae bacterium]|nr:hypothetical protein [Selenomonadaceae bacterium]
MKSESKSELRRKLLETRRNFKDDESPKIIENFLRLPELQKSQTIFAYAPTPDEIQIDPLLEKLIANGNRVAIPFIISKSEMVATEIFVLSELIQSKFKIQSSKNSCVRFENQFWKIDSMNSVKIFGRDRIEI